MQTNAANLSDRDMRDIADWLAAQRSLPGAYQPDPAKVAVGKARAEGAEELGCATCHSPPSTARATYLDSRGRHPDTSKRSLKTLVPGSAATGTGQVY